MDPHTSTPPFGSILEDPWRPEKWHDSLTDGRAGNRLLEEALAKLELLFPDEWRRGLIASSKYHPVVGDILTLNGRDRLLALGKRVTIRREIPWMAGKLRDPRQYGPIVAEFLIQPFLNRLGRAEYQPFGPNRKGCDYIVWHGSRCILVEIKRLSQSQLSTRAENKFLKDNLALLCSSGTFSPLPPRNESHEARRLYRHVSKAAKQIDHARKDDRAGRLHHGLLILDLDADGMMLNLSRRLIRWMGYFWARPIDAVLFVEHRSEDGRWGTCASLVFRRTRSIEGILMSEIGRCPRGHFHVGNHLIRTCKNPFMG